MCIGVLRYKYKSVLTEIDALLNTKATANTSHSVQLSASIYILYSLYSHAQSGACEAHEEFNMLQLAYVKKAKEKS